jgi:succinoglycan biosynthesis transport protein ExoP
MNTSKMSVFQIIRSLWAGKYLLAPLAMIFCFLGLVIGLSIPKTYTAEGLLVLEPRDVKIDQLGVAATASDSDLVRTTTEAEVLRSRGAILKVVRDLDLVNNPAILQPETEINPVVEFVQYAKAAVVGLARELLERADPGTPATPADEPYTASDMESDAVNVVFDSLSVLGIEKSSAIRISFTSTDNALAAEVVNRLMSAYREEQIELKAKETAHINQMLSSRLEPLRRDMEDADRRIQDFRRDHGLIETGAGEMSIVQLSDLQNRLTVAQADEKTLQLKVAAASRALSSSARDASTDVLTSPIIQRLIEREGTVAGNLSNLEQNLGPRHPQVAALRQELDSIRLQLSTETSKVLSALRTDLQVANQRVGSLESALAEARKAAEQSTADSVILQQLVKDAEAKRQIFATYLASSQQTSSSQLDPSPYVRIASAAVPPPHPNRSGTSILMALGALGGLALGAAIILSRQATRTWILDGEELVEATGFSRLCDVPETSRFRKKHLQNVVIDNTDFAATESIRGIWVNLQVASEGNPMVTLVTSGSPAEGKSSLVIALGRIAALDGARVMILDCDFHKPSIGRLLGVGRRRAGSGSASSSGTVTWIDEMLADKDANQLNFQEDAATGMKYLPAAGTLDNPHAVLSGKRLSNLIGDLRREFDLILIDSPPVMSVADPVTLVRHTDTLVYVAASAKTPRWLITEAVRRLSIPARVKAFSVLVRVRPSRRLPKRYYTGYDKRARHDRRSRPAHAVITHASGRA